MTSILKDLFANCPNATNFTEIFADCAGLTNYLLLWNSEYYNGGNTNVDIDKLLQNEENINAIPEYWRIDLSN